MTWKALALAAVAAAAAVSAATTAVYGEAQIIATGGGKGAAALSRLLATYPHAATGSLTARAGQHVTVTFDVTEAGSQAGLSPHQSFVRFTQADTGAVTYFVAAPDATVADKPGAHKLSLDLNDRKGLQGVADGGTFHVDIVVGDATLTNPVQWRVGKVELQPAAAPTKPAPLLYSQPLLHESDIATQPLREIAHAFRAPEKRPPTVVSYTAAALVVAAFAVWVGYVVSLPGVTLALPATAALWAVLFFSGLAAIGALFTLYWLQLNMFTTLGYLTLLALPTAFFGRQMLVAVQRAKQA